jgi:protein TonB
MPYGAPDLLSVSRTHMARSVALSAFGWAACFFVACLVVARLPEAIETIEIPPAPHFMDDLIQLEKVKLPEPAGPVVPTPPKDGVFIPSELAPKAESFPIGAPMEGLELPAGPLGESRPGVTVAGPPLEPAPDERVYVEFEVEQPPVEVRIVKPDYPPFAREAGVEGLVVVRVLVGRNGKVEDARIVRSILLLDESSLAAARTMVFTPALVRGRPVRAWVQIPFRYSLH